jgi:hypothetical protein
MNREKNKQPEIKIAQVYPTTEELLKKYAFEQARKATQEFLDEKYGKGKYRT